MSSTYTFPSPENLGLASRADGTKWNDTINAILDGELGGAVISSRDSLYRARLNDGTTLTHATDVCTLISNVLASSAFVSGSIIAFKPSTTPYNAGTVSAQVTLTKDVRFLGYGATIKGIGDHNFGAFFYAGDGITVCAYGLTFDQNKLQGLAFGGGSGPSNQTSKLVLAKDCTFLNVDNYGISVAAGNNQSGNGDSTLIIEDCEFSAGGSNSANEFVLSNAVRSVSIKNCRMYGNKLCYLSGRQVSVDGLYSDGTGFTGHAGIGVHAITADLTNLHLDDHPITLRPYGTVHFGTLYASAKRLSLTNSTIDYVTSPIEISAYNDTYIIDQVLIDNVWLNDGNVLVTPFTAQTHTKIKQLLMTNVHISDFNSNNCALLAEDHDFDQLVIKNLYSPAYTTVNNPVRINCTQSNLNIAYMDIDDIHPLPPTNMYTINDSSNTHSVTITIKKPLRNGVKATRVLNTATQTQTWFENYGTGSITSLATSAVITHGLAYTPNASHINVVFTENPTNKPRMWYPSAIGATTFTVNVDGDPGASNLDFSWSAGV